MIEMSGYGSSQLWVICTPGWSDVHTSLAYITGWKIRRRNPAVIPPWPQPSCGWARRLGMGGFADLHCRHGKNDISLSSAPVLGVSKAHGRTCLHRIVFNPQCYHAGLWCVCVRVCVCECVTVNVSSFVLNQYIKSISSQAAQFCQSLY